MSGSSEPRGLRGHNSALYRSLSFVSRAADLKDHAKARLHHEALLQDFLTRLLPELQNSQPANLQFQGLSPSKFLEQFSPSSQNLLREVLGRSGLESLLSLSQELDSQYFSEALLNLGQRLAASDQEAGALALWTFLSSRPEGLDPSVASRALAERDALLGQGGSALRFEVSLRHLRNNVTDPTLLGGMMAGSIVAQGVKAFSLAGLLGKSASWWNRGVALRLASGSLAFAAEVPTMALATKTLKSLSGQSQDWSASALGRESLELGVSLFFLKAAGSFAQTSFQKFHGIDPLGLAPARLSALTRYSQPLFTQVGMLGGLVLGQHALRWAEGKPLSDEVGPWFASLATLLELNIGGHVAGKFLGATWGQGLRELELRSRLAESSAEIKPPGPARWTRPNPLLLPKNLRFAFDAPGTGGLGPRIEVQKPFVNKMATLSGGSDSPEVFLERRLREVLEKRFGVDERIEKIAKAFAKTPFSVQAEENRASYYDLLTRSQVMDWDHGDGRTTSALEILHIATRVFSHALEMNPFRRAVGSYYDYLMQVAFERVLAEKKVHAFDGLMRLATFQRTVGKLENFFVTHGFDIGYEMQKSLWRHNLSDKPEWVKTLLDLPLTRATQNRIGNYLASFTLGEFSEKFRRPEFNFLMLKPRGQKPRHEPMQAQFAVETLKNLLQNPDSAAIWSPVLEDCVKRSQISPVPMLTFDRIFKVLATGDLNEKIAEVAFGGEFNWLNLQERLNQGFDPDFEKAGEAINASVYTAYLDDPILAEKFARFYQALPTSLHPDELQRNRAEFQRKAEFLLEGKKNFGREEVLEMLFHRPTELAQQARQAILQGEVDFKVYSKKQMQGLWKILKKSMGTLEALDMVLLEAQHFRTQEKGAPNLKGETPEKVLGLENSGEIEATAGFEEPPSGIFLPGWKLQSGKALIAITELDPELSAQQKIIRAVYLPAFAVHEFEHYLHHQDLSFQKLHQMMRGEMRSWLEENYYLLQQGESSEWEKSQILSPYGFGIYLRNLIDKDYIQGPRDLVFVHRRPKLNPPQ